MITSARSGYCPERNCEGLPTSSHVMNFKCWLITSRIGVWRCWLTGVLSARDDSRLQRCDRRAVEPVSKTTEPAEVTNAEWLEPDFLWFQPFAW